MPGDPIDRENVSFVGHHDCRGRPPFKIDLQVVDDTWYCYLASKWHSGWTILDVTAPSDPEFVAFVEGPANTHTGQIQVADGLMITSLERANPAAAGNPVEGKGPKFDPDEPSEEGAYIWDVASDPESPTRLGHYTTGGGGTHRNFYNGGSHAFMAANPPGFTGEIPAIVDLTDPTEPTEVGRWWWPGQSPGDDETAGSPFYFHGPAYPDGDRAYLSYGREGLVTLDISDVTDPTLEHRLSFGDFGSRLGVHSAIPIPDTDLLAVNTEAIDRGHPRTPDGEAVNFTVLVDASEEVVGADGSPRIIGWCPIPTPSDAVGVESFHDRAGRFGPHNQAHFRPGGNRLRTDEYLFMTYFNAGLRVFDVSDPLAPTEAGHYLPENPTERIGYPRPGGGLVSTFEDVVVEGRGYIYCSEPQQGLFVLETELVSP